jgi:hypothetical protein
MYLCVRGIYIKSGQLDVTSHCPDLVQIPLAHKHMTYHCPDLVHIPEMSCICVLGVSSQNSEMSCICVLVVSVPSRDSEMSCICVLVVSVPGRDSEMSTPNTQTHDISLS